MANLPLLCPVCKSPSYRTKLANCRDLVCHCPGKWDLVECSSCGLVYTAPRIPAEELIKYYPQSYSPYVPTGNLRASRVGGLLRKAAMLPYSLRFGSPDWNEKPPGTGRLLDVGCGAGIFLREAEQQGWKAWGIDLSPVAVETAARNAPNATVRLGTLDDLPATEKFELINMSHILEHLAEPRRAVEQCFERLVPGGRLRISLPNIRSFEAALFRRAWRPLDIPRHTVHFSRDVLERLLLEIGFVKISTRPSMLAASFSESLLLALPARLGKLLMTTRGARLLYLSMVFPASLSYAFGNAGAIEVTATRPEDPTSEKL